MMESNASLLARARRGDTAAAGDLLRRHFRACYLVALARLGNRADAEDVCQDAFVRCLARLDDCREPEKFGAWLLRIVRNLAHNRGDYLRVRSTEPLDAHAMVPSVEPADAKVHQSEVVLLHDLEGWRHAEIAVQLELSEPMSRRHLSDARRRLRTLLGDYATLEPDHD
jgi:RNA polymerase sigma-70 factor (ECF subfamily)